MNQRYLNQHLFNQSIFPQYKSFCGVCSIIAVVNSEFNTGFTQDSLHSAYHVGLLTKRNVAFDANPRSEDLAIVDPNGMSNYDIIRLFNSVAIDNETKPYSALLTGQNFAQVEPRVLSKWFKQQGNYLIFHSQNHYFPIIGFVEDKHDMYWIRSDSSYLTQNPVFSTKHTVFAEIAASSDKYGFILLSTSKIDFLDTQSGLDFESAFPIESLEAIRVKRYTS